MLFAGRAVHIGENCARGLECSRPRAQFFCGATKKIIRTVKLRLRILWFFYIDIRLDKWLEPLIKTVFCCKKRSRKHQKWTQDFETVRSFPCYNMIVKLALHIAVRRSNWKF